MSVPSSVADLSTSKDSNYPSGTESIGTSMDDYIRAIQAIIKQQDSRGADIASMTTISIPNIGSYFVVTGTTNISAINDCWAGRTVSLKFSGALTLSNSSGLILPGGANITTAAGDTLLITNESTGVWRVVAYLLSAVAPGVPYDGSVTPAKLSTGHPTWDAAGNLGLGVAPSAWSAPFSKAIDVGSSGALATTATSARVANNAFYGASGWTYKNSAPAAHYDIIDNTHAWFVAPAGTAGTPITFTQAMTLDAIGNMLIGTSVDPSATQKGIKLSNNLNVVGSVSSCGSTTTSIPHFYFFNGNGSVGSISTNGSSTTYGTSSDYRLKENIVPMFGALERVMALKPCTYNWKADGSEGEGFIAHELAEVCPQAVTGEKDAVDEELKPIYQGIDTSFVVVILTAAIQELNAKLEAQDAEIQMLKERL